MPGPTCFQTLFPLQNEPTVGKAKQTQLILELTILLAQLALTYTSAHIFLNKTKHYIRKVLSPIISTTLIYSTKNQQSLFDLKGKNKASPVYFDKF